MIYLIDDKINRQIDAGWDSERFEPFVNLIKPIHLFSEIESINERLEIFSDKNNIIFFHESFFDNVLNRHHREGHEIRNRLIEFSIQNPTFYLVFFSGSKNTRSISKNIVHLPVYVLYQNLEIFLFNLSNNDLNLRYLMFGKKHQIEEELLIKLNIANQNIEDDFFLKDSKSKNFVAVSQLGEIEAPIGNAVYETLFADDLSENFKNEIDQYNNAIINEWLKDNEYDNIFIPISFGPTLSDFNGLRLAAYIRCSKSPNRLKNIFIYSYVDFSELISNEYFDILKTKNVFLIKHSKKDFINAVNREYSFFSSKELPNEIAKLSIKTIQGQLDSHSIANEWAIYRWSCLINAIDKDIEKTIHNVEINLHFKYLSTIYPISEIISIPDEKLKFTHEGHPKILLIDDEAEKGWSEIFSKIISDINKIVDFHYLDEELNAKTKEEIIEISINKIMELQCDLVFLDFRLHEEDTFTSNFEEITGIRILREIKKYNPGIQVIIFTASNKAWNMQSLLDAGADGFIIKESPSNTIDNSFTSNSIKKLTTQLQECLQMQFLKTAYKLLEMINKHLSTISISTNISGIGGLEKLNFKNQINLQCQLTFECLKNTRIKTQNHKENDSGYFNLAFISTYKILELFNDFYTDDSGKKLKSNQKQIHKYNSNENSFTQIKNEAPISSLDKFFSILHFEFNYPVQKISSKLSNFNNIRNKIIHPKNMKEYYKTSPIENINFIETIKDTILIMK